MLMFSKKSFLKNQYENLGVNELITFKKFNHYEN